MSIQKPIHGESAPLWKIHGLKQFPPVPCLFKLNDRVIFTNDNGASFEQTIIGFSSDDSFQGRFVHAISETWEGSAGWFPHHPKSLKLIESSEVAA